LRVDTRLGDRDHVQRTVEPSIAAAVQAMTNNLPRRSRYRRRAGLSREVRIGGKALRARGAADQRRRRQRAAALLGQERRPMRHHQRAQLALEPVDLSRQSADLTQLLARHARPWIVPEASQPPRYALLHHLTGEAPVGQLRLELGAQLEQMPAQPVLNPGALAHQLIAVV
jgi:hypothetical protein